MWKGNKHKSMKWTNKQNWREQLDRAKIFDKMMLIWKKKNSSKSLELFFGIFIFLHKFISSIEQYKFMHQFV